MIGSGEDSLNLIQQMFTEPGTVLGAEAPAWSEQVPALKRCIVKRMRQWTPNCKLLGGVQASSVMRLSGGTLG